MTPSKIVLLAASLILALSMISIASASGPSAVQIQDSTGTNSAGVDVHGNLETRICDQTNARCATVNSGDLFVKVEDQNGDNQVFCNSSVAISEMSNTTSQLVASSGTKNIYVCGYDFMANGTVNVTLESATSGTCGGTVTPLTGAYNMLAGNYVSKPNSSVPAFSTGGGNQLCISLSASQQVSGVLTYAQF